MNYILMHKRKKVAQVALDQAGGYVREIGHIYAPEHIPVGVAVKDGRIQRAELSAWWHRRAIPASRAGLRETLEAIGVDSPEYLLERCYGLSLSDQYWMQPEGSGLTWDEVNFFEHDFSEDMGNILLGHMSFAESLSLMSPDNSSDGWLRKKWSVFQGKRVLLKGGSGVYRQEPYNEVIACAIMKRLGISHVPYRLFSQKGDVYSVCPDFVTPDEDFITAAELLRGQKQPNHLSGAGFFVSLCEGLGIKEAQLFLDQMLTLDFLIANEDRHTGNFGVIRNAETLEYTGMAPLYDNGTSLWMNLQTSRIKPCSPKLASKPFKPTHSQQIKLVRSFEWLDLKKLDGIEEECKAILSWAEDIDEERQQAICRGIRARIRLLGEVSGTAQLR